MTAGRPRLRVGEHGTITVREEPNGAHRARCRMRMSDGSTRQVESRGPTGPKATRALNARLAVLKRGVGADGITPDTTMAALLDRWIKHRRAITDISVQSLDDYARCIASTIVPVMGATRIGEVTPGIADAKILSVASATPARAKQMRTILRQALAMAVRHGAIEMNPVHDLTRLKSTRRKTTVSLTAEQRSLVRHVIATWEAGDRRRSKDIGRILDIQLATAARIGEVLALRWSDVDLAATPAMVAITGTEVTNSVAGHHRQDHTKGGKAGQRVAIPSWATAILLAQRIDASESLFVFPSRAGTMRSQNNVRTSLRAALKGTKVQGLTPHVMRSTVATVLKEDVGIEAAADQLGHTSTKITERYYIEDAVVAPDVSVTLEQLGPEMTAQDDGASHE